ncbi:protein LATERAL ROOT PRIMORDIUM 1 [Cornus florida]|uniref:protein LATERAL ROOT PRIMORDIUM 1 n=1 Tax=Cornus florida TaxID=4283 RepID=UPI0028A02DFD|nr:protein LATERAL ROOT PRIMORDIUM 1 [Cornus florida]
MWSSSSRPVNYGLPAEMGMLGLRDVFLVAPQSSFHHNEPIISDPHAINASNAATALGVGIIPLLTAAPCLAPPNMGVDDDDMNSNRNNRSGGNGIQFWQNQPYSHQHSNYMKKPMILDHSTPANLLQSGGGGGSSGGGIGGSSASSMTTTCQDCGNQAKKDCTHRRCRTCCKSRGFDCATHVKSTWVPAARRRERQLMAATTAAAGSSGSTSGAKKPRLVTSQTTTTSHNSTSNTTPPRSFDTSSSHQDASFKEALPGQVRAPAVFKCVRVTAVDDGGEDEYAYQAVVKIGGHVFKGFLYDQGVETRDGFPNLSELHLGGGSSGGGGGGARNGASSSPILDPSDVYAASGGGLLGGSSYGNPIN